MVVRPKESGVYTATQYDGMTLVFELLSVIASDDWMVLVLAENGKRVEEEDQRNIVPSEMASLIETKDPRQESR
jgi:hypothetical protein